MKGIPQLTTDQSEGFNNFYNDMERILQGVLCKVYAKQFYQQQFFASTEQVHEALMHVNPKFSLNLSMGVISMQEESEIKVIDYIHEIQ